MHEITKIGYKAKTMLKELERELIETALSESSMQQVLDQYVHSIIPLYYELNQLAEESYNSIRCSKEAKRMLLAARKLRVIIEKILLAQKMTNDDVSNWFFEYKSLDLTILVEFEKIFEDEELPF